jgi:hypothetical protein
MYDQSRADDAPTSTIVAALFVSGLITGLVFLGAYSLVNSAPLELGSVIPAIGSNYEVELMLVFVLVTALLGAILLRLFLMLLAGVDLSVVAAFVVLVAGHVPSFLLNRLVPPSSAQAPIRPYYMLLVPATIFAAYALQVVLVRSLARSPSAPTEPPPSTGEPPWVQLRKYGRIR